MLTLTSIGKTFLGGFKPVLTNINLHLNPNDFCMVIGSNGSGKSTLIKIISGEYASDTGKIIIEDDDLTNQDRSHAIASVTQDVNQGTIPEMTLLENMTLSLSRTKKTGFSFYHRRANQVTQKVKALGIGLEQYLDTPLSHLSGGQRQMVATIMAVTSRPKLLLLDEHTSALDPSTQRMVMAYTAKAIAEQQLTSLMITHNLADAIHYGNRLIMLHKGQIVFDVSGKEKSFLKMNELLALFHIYEDTVLLEDPL
ncbi:MAG: ATP-binding cassette domain-containing protein [Legionellaceae bacterium]|nr:ATP-binding cassette domain-containing protein [Legionellaceae bacterium]